MMTVPEKNTIVDLAKKCKAKIGSGEVYLVLWSDKRFGVVQRTDVLFVLDDEEGTMLDGDPYQCKGRAKYGSDSFMVTFLEKGKQCLKL